MIQLNETEIQRFIQLQSQATPGNYAPIYKELADLLTGKYSVSVTDSSVLWLRGATEANAGRGAFSALIRGYTESQYQLRYGTSIPTGPTDKLQDASDAVAKNLLRDLTGGNPLWPRGQMPDIRQIAIADATAVGDMLFGPKLGHGDTDTAFIRNSAWSGSLLFSLLRSDQTSRLMQGGGDPAKIDTLNDWRDVLYAYKSYEAGFIAARSAYLFESQDQAVVDTGILGATALGYVKGPGTLQSLKDAAVSGTPNPTLKEAFKVISDVGQNKFLDMLMGAVQGKPLIGTTTDTNFQANNQAFFGALTPAQLQAINAMQMPLDAAEMAGLASKDANARAALAALSVVSVQVSNTVADQFKLYNATTGQGSITQDWIVDRAAFTANYYKKLQGLGGIVSGSENARYYDTATNTEVLVGAGSAQRKQFIFGAVTDDTQVGQGFNDHLYGGAGNDSLAGRGGNDYLEGGTGNDTYLVESNSRRDIVFDIDGQGSIQLDGDTLTGGAQYGDNRVYRSADKKHLYVLASDNTLLIDGQIVVEGYNKTRGDLGLTYSAAPTQSNPSTSVIKGDLKPINFGTDMDPRYEIDELGNVKVGTEIEADRNDTINTPQASNSWVQAGGGRDWVRGGAGNDLLEGGAGNDILEGGTGDDRLFANSQMTVAQAIAEGNSQIGTGLPGEFLTGNAGDDIAVGSANNDTILGGAGANLLIGGAGDDLVSADEDVIPTRSWYTTLSGGATYNSSWRIYNVAVRDVARAEVGNSVLYLGNGNDVGRGGYGNDVIFGEAGDDFVVGGSGNDALFGGAGRDIVLGDFENNLAADQGDDYLSGGADDDELYGYGGSDILVGGTGNDKLVGGAGQDIYIFNKGDGSDIVIDNKAEKNILRFGAGVLSSDITLRLGSLMLDLGNGDAVHIENFNRDDVYNSVGIDSFEFADGSALSTTELLARGFDLDGTAQDDVIRGTNITDRIQGFAGNDVLLGFEGDDTLIADGGNDLLEGGEGNDTYVIGTTAGQVTLLIGLEPGQTALAAGADRIVLAGSKAQNLWTAARVDNSLVLTAQQVGNSFTSSVRLEGYFDSGVGSAVWSAATVEFRDGGALTVQELLASTSLATEGNDAIYGGLGNDVIDALGGDDTVFALAGADAVYAGLGNDMVDAGDGDDLVDGGAGNDMLAGGNGNDTLRGGADNDVISGDAGADTLWGDAGDDTLLGGLGADRLNGGDGADLIDGGDGADLLDGAAGDDQLLGGSDNDRLNGGDGNDTLTGGAGADQLAGGAGNDIYVFDANLPGQADAIDDVQGINVIRLDGVTSVAASALRNAVQVFEGDNNDYTVIWGKGSVRIAGGAEALSRMRLDVDGVQTSLTDYLVTTPPSVPASTQTQLNANFLTQRESRARAEIAYAGSIGALAWRYEPSESTGAFLQPISSDAANADVSQSSFLPGSTPYYYTYNGYRNAAGQFFTSNTTTTSVTTYTYTLTRYDNNRNLSSPGPVTVVNYTNSVTTETTSLIPGLTPVSERRTGYTSGYTFIPAAASVEAVLGDSANNFTFSAGLVRGGGGDDQITANLASFSRETYAVSSYYGIPYPVNAARTIKLSERNTTLLTGLTTATWIDGGDGNDSIVGSEAADVIHGGSGFNSLDAGAGPDRYLVLDLGASNAGFDYIADTGISLPLKPDLSEAYGGLAQEVLPPGVDIDTVEFGPGIKLNELQFSVKTRDQSFATYYGGSPQSLLPYGVDIDAAAFGAGIQFDPTFFNPTVGSRGRSPYLVVERDGRRLAAIELVTFNPGSPSSGAGVEFLQFQDGQKITLRTAVQSAFAQPGNQSPVVLSPLTQQQTPEDSAWSFSVPLATFTNTDGKPLAYSATRGDGSPLPSWLSFDSATRTFSGLPLNANVGEIALNVVATDSMGLSANANFTLSVTNVNDVPVVSFALTSQSATQGTLWEYVLPSDLFTDVDVGDTLALSAALIDGTVLPSWLRFDVATGTFSGRPLGINVGNLNVKVTATDKAGAQVSSLFSVNVSSTNHAPVAALLLDQQAIETQAFTYTLPLNTFTDVDSGDALTLKATLFNGAPLPEWLSFNTATGTFNGTPPDTAAGSFAVTVTATDEQGASVFSTFNLGVANILNGTAQDDVLVGTAGNDVIDGGLGADRMSGGKGDDVYLVDNVLDKVVEKVAEGRDSIRSTVTYTLAVSVEDLVLVGTAVIDGVGNALDNRIEGNSADNKLIGGAGDDVLSGGEGDDWLRGGVGSDMLAGGTGDDLYEVDTANDVVLERASEGIDTVEASVTYSLSAKVENLILTGTLAADGLGNALDNILQGNDASNVLTGAGGNDTLNGKKGIDTLAGGLGNDTYLLEDDVDTIVELAGEGRDVVISRFAFNLGINIEDGVLLGSATDITGNELSNVLTGNGLANTINGGAGADVMLGGKGNDIYVVDSQADTIIEVAGEGTDTAQASVNYTLADNVENLALTGSAEAGMGNSLNNKLTGNALSNKLFGDAGNDDLDGGEGADILIGGLGNDDYWVDSSSDLVVEAANEGTDTVYASVSYALADNVERLVLTGSANINAVGNAGNNRLEGNAGNNILYGGLGNDIYVFGRGSGHDVVANFDAGKPSGDVVQLGVGITDTDVSLLRQGNDLVLRINGTDDRLTVASYFENAGKGANALEKIRFADGTSLNHAAVLSKTAVSSGVSDAQGMPTGLRTGDPTALFNAPDAAASKTSDAAITPQSVAESISQAKVRFEQTLQNLKTGTNEQGGLSRSEFAERRALPLLWNLQDALLNLQLAKNADGRFTASVSIDSRATRDLGLGISMLGATNGVGGQLNQVARPGEVQQFDLAQIR